jgi:hypothetical protein
LVADGFDEPWDYEDMQGPSQQEMSHLLKDVVISTKVT